MVLYEELAAHDAPRLVLAFVAIHHAASTLLVAGSEEQRRRHLPAILDGEIWVQGFSEPDAGSDLAALKAGARRHGDVYVVNGQKVWASGAHYADWCLLLARTDPDAPKRHGISYFLMDMRTPGVEVRPIRQATGESHFCEIFLNDVEIPARQLIGPENEGWSVAQATLSAERGMTMLELAERLGAGGFSWLVRACCEPGPGGDRAVDDPAVRDALAGIETEIAGLRALCSRLVLRHEAGDAGPADASVVKLFYSELLQRMMDFATEVNGLGAHEQLHKPALERLGVGRVDARLRRFLGMDDPGRDERDPADDHRRARARASQGAGRADVSADFTQFHGELRSVARRLLTREHDRGGPVVLGRSDLAASGWLGLEVPDALGWGRRDLRRDRGGARGAGKGVGL